MMRVLTIMTTPFTYDGISNVVLNYYKNFQSRVINMDFALPGKSNKTRANEQLNKSNSKIYYLPSRTKNLYNYLKQLNEILDNNEYDVVHIHGNSSTMLIETSLAKKNKVKGIIPHAHNTFSKYPFLDNLLSGKFLSSYSYALACGIDAGRFLYKGDKFSVLDNGIRVEDYKYNIAYREQIRNSLNIKKDEIVIGHVGHFTYQKNQEYLINLISRNKLNDKKIKLLLVGNGENKEALKKIVKNKNLSETVLFLGNRSDVNQIYSAMDLLVMPSRFEGLPLTLIEAQSADLKCFISDKITKEVVQTNLIEYFKIEEFGQLESKIRNYIENPINREEHYNFNIVKHSKFNIKNSVDKLEDIYLEYN